MRAVTKRQKVQKLLLGVSTGWCLIGHGDAAHYFPLWKNESGMAILSQALALSRRYSSLQTAFISTLWHQYACPLIGSWVGWNTRWYTTRQRINRACLPSGQLSAFCAATSGQMWDHVDRLLSQLALETPFVNWMEALAWAAMILSLRLFMVFSFRNG